jgi:hypothetical protein
MSLLKQARRDDGAVAVLYAIVFAVVLVPMLGIGTTALVRATTTGELQRAADAGSLAGAASIPTADVNFARSFLAATAGGPTDQTLRNLGLDYPGHDPLTVACDDVAVPNATDQHNVAVAGKFAGAPTCQAKYLSDADTLSAVRQCADALATSATGSTGITSGTGLPGLPSVPGLPDLSPLLPVLLRPGVQVTMSWPVHVPMDKIFNNTGTTETFTSIAHRRFKNIVVVPEATLPTGTTINLNPLAGDVRTAVLDAMDGTDEILRSVPATAVCAGVLDGARDDIADAIDPPGGGPDAATILDDAIASNSPILVARVVTVANSLGVPYLDFVPVCAERVASNYVGHLTSFGACTLSSPGAYRASLRRH